MRWLEKVCRLLSARQPKRKRVNLLNSHLSPINIYVEKSNDERTSRCIERWSAGKLHGQDELFGENIQRMSHS